MIIAYGGYQDTTCHDTATEDTLTKRIGGLLQSLEPSHVVGSLTPGAEILFARTALAEQQALHVALPYGRDEFRATVVVPAGERWVREFDRIVATENVTVFEGALNPDDDDVYRQNVINVLDHSARMASSDGTSAWVIAVRPNSAVSSPTAVDELVDRGKDRGMLTLDIDPLPKARKRAFIVMPYGKKKDPRVNRYIDCDLAFHRVYRPLLEDFDVDWIRADLQVDSSIIHTAMIAELANCDLVLADLTAINFNVAYEVGVRHVFASNSTILIDPHVSIFRKKPPPQFDVNMIRTHSYVRDATEITDAQAASAITTLKPVVQEALQKGIADSPCHEWFDLNHIRRPFARRAAVPDSVRADTTVRGEVAEAVRRSDVEAMRSAADTVTKNVDISGTTRRACRIELASGLLREREHAAARDLLDVSQPPIDDGMHRTWLHQAVMAYRRLGEQATDPDVQRGFWDTAKRYLEDAESAGYRDSETYGIWGGLLKRQFHLQHATLDEQVAHSLFAQMEQRYRSGFRLDPQYYTGINIVMAMRFSGRDHDETFTREFNEIVTVSRFLARLAVEEDPTDFYAAVTLAELSLHEALESRGPIDDAVRLYADAAHLGRPDEIDSAKFQLDFLRTCGESDELISRVANAIDQAI